MNKNVLVSVFMITYNHEKYIKQALDSILAQQCNFDFEIVVGEDCSTDATRFILNEYHEKHLGKFNLLLHPVNIGAMNNQIATMRECKAKYIAMCEGDDYWSDPLKLQKQVDFLESHPAYTFVGHWVKMLHQKNGSLTSYYSDFKDNPIQLKDTVIYPPLPTCSYFARNNMGLPKGIKHLPAGDDALLCHWASHGLGYCIPEYMGVYRVSDSGTWSTLIDSEKEFRIMVIRLWIFSYYRPLFKRQALKIAKIFILILKNNATQLRRLSLRSWLSLIIPILVLAYIIVTNQTIKILKKWLKKLFIKTSF